MFLRRLFKVGDKAKWLFLELMVVFVGVYLAFLFQTYGEQKKVRAEREKVFSALKTELEFFRIKGPGMASYTFSVWKEQRALYRDSAYRDFSGWRFLEPQYGYQIIEYAINLENTSIIDFQLYDALQTLHSSIKRLEHAERLMMEMAHKYRAIPKSLSARHPEVALRKADNYTNFRKLAVFTRDRAVDQQEVAKNSVVCLDIINERMDQENRKMLETNLINGQIEDFDSVEEAVKNVRKYFPNFTEEDVREIYQKHLDAKGK